MEIWNIIVQTNTFNFIIFVLIFAIIFKFAKVGNMLTGMQNKIAKFIDDSKSAKADSIQELQNAKKTVSKLGEEINEIVKNADLNAVRLTRKMLADANVMSDNIVKSAEKICDSTGKKIISELTLATAEASVELAKKHIIRVLEQKPQYHAKFIQDSIDEIDRFSFNE